MVKRIAYFSLSSTVYGGETMLLALLSHLDRARFDPLVVVPDTGRLTDALDKMKIRHLGRSSVNLSPLRTPAQLASAIRFLRTNRVDLLHFNSPVYWRPPEVLAAILTRTPVVTHAHLVIDKPSPFLKYSKVVIANSRFTASASAAPEERTSVIHNGVELGRFDAARDIRQKIGLSPRDLVVTYVGQIKPIKGIELFVDMANRIENEHVRFLIVGDSQDHDYLNKLKDRFRLDSRFRYSGFRRDIENIYASSDVIVMPSQWEEPFGLIGIEAGAASKPIIATRVGGIPEVVKHGTNGFLVDKRDIEGLVRYLRLLIQDKELRASMGAAGRAVVESEFGILQYTDRVQNIYDTLLN